MKTNKKAFTLIELIVSIFLISIISIYGMLFYKNTYLSFENEFEKEKLKLQFINTKLFLEKNKALENLSLKDSKLYYNNHLLLKNVTNYSLIKDIKNTTISFCIEEKLCKKIKILK